MDPRGNESPLVPIVPRLVFVVRMVQVLSGSKANTMRRMALAAVAVLGCVVWGFNGNAEDVSMYGSSALRWWWHMTAMGREFDHGRLIPFVCGYLVWLRRKELAAAAGRPDWLGVLVAMAAMVMYWFGVQGQQVQIALYAFWIMVCAVVLGVWGREVFRIVRFPVAYLFLAFPLGFLYPLTFPLRLASTGLAEGLLNGGGIAVVRNGTALHDAAGMFHLEVADPCSGLRSVFALFALTAVYAYLTLKGYKRWLLVATTVPLAIGANAVRITTVGVVARFYGQERATGFYHDFSGYVFFVSATLMMLAVAWLFGRLPDRKPREAPVERDSTVTRENAGNADGARIVGREQFAVLGIPVVMGMAAIWVVVRVPLSVSDQLPITANLPLNIGSYVGEQNYYCQNENCLKTFPESIGGTAGACPNCRAKLDIVSLAERRGLPADTRVAKRVYRNNKGSVLSVNTVIAGEDRRSIHRPEHCLPAQGYSIEKIRHVKLVLDNGHKQELALISVRNTASEMRTGFAYWFAGPGRETASHLDRHFWTAYDRLFRNTASRWAYVSIMSNKPFDTPEDLAELGQFITELRKAIAVKQE